MVELPSSPLADVDPEFERMALETGGLTYQLTGTSIREKLLQNLTNDVCRLQMGLAFELHVTAANMHGIPYADLLALIRFVAPYAGYPAAADALARLKEVATSIGMDTTADETLTVEPGDGKPIESLHATDPWMVEFLASRTHRAWSEERLSRRERAFIALTTDVSQQTLGHSFRRHTRLALDAGATRDEVRDVVRFCAEMSLAKAVTALAELDVVLAEL
ncbi:carboxymuconolactone decarboxylase family protein [Micromonospora phytophila]|uniref:carboxymuconolactone decarboxylase family protein n=1 Tax=Micromonospora phytophila TaxID=709888 RepID=UPI0020300157|nr:carboxymuconolactone decarboxylase family protein [Micromonospora phytophila]MCM0673348.1 carboxymuconolactone decarboxylase family protein [Micromonospora phytophila]